MSYIVLSYPILSYPILFSPLLFHPIQRYPTPSYPITLDDIILHPGPYLSYLILSNLIVYDPILTHATTYHPIPSNPKISCQSFVLHPSLPHCFCLQSPIITLQHGPTSPSHSSPRLTPLPLIFIICCWMKLYTALCYLLDKHAYPVVWPLQL